MFERFENVREQLLRAGVAPRHAKRYLRELNDHFDDLVREHTETGMDRQAAEVAARQRLGTDASLIAAVTGRPELRSLIARHPWAAFGFSPVLALVAGVTAAALIERVLIGSVVSFSVSTTTTSVIHPAWLKASIAVTNAAVNYALPLAIAGLVGVLGTRRRVSHRFILLGVVLASVVGAGHQIFVRWSDVLGHSELGVGFIGPGYTKTEVLLSAIRAAVNLAVCGLAAMIWRGMRQRVID